MVAYTIRAHESSRRQEVKGEENSSSIPGTVRRVPRAARRARRHQHRGREGARPAQQRRHAPGDQQVPVADRLQDAPEGQRGARQARQARQGRQGRQGRQARQAPQPRRGTRATRATPVRRQRRSGRRSTPRARSSVKGRRVGSEARDRRLSRHLQSGCDGLYVPGDARWPDDWSDYRRGQRRPAHGDRRRSPCLHLVQRRKLNTDKAFGLAVFC